MTTIEDVDFLIENSVKDATTIYVDSSLRNKRAYPTAAEYVVEFDRPIRQVHTLQILDCSIPATMYTVDAHNERACMLRFFGPKSDPLPASITLPSEVKAFVAAHQDALVHIMDGKKIFDKANRQAMVFTQAQWDAIPSVNRQTIEGSALNENTATSSIVRLGATPAQDQVYFVSSSFFGEIKDMNDAQYSFLIERKYIKLTRGNYDILLYLNLLTITLVEFGIVVTPVNGNIERQLRVTYGCRRDPLNDRPFVFVFDMEDSPGAALFGFNTPANTNNPDSYTKIDFKDNIDLFMCNVVPPGLDPFDGQFTMTAPDMINLNTIKYVILRCKEIEDMLEEQPSYEGMAPGIGIFKLFGDYSVTNLRFDFTNLVRKPFHPIGKLTRLSFRFEREPNVLYDFKGVDHQMLLMVGFYAPQPQSRSNKKSTLNPDYDPNFLNYLVREARFHNAARELELSSLRSMADDALLKQKLAYEHSSSEEEDDSEEDSDDDDSEEDA